MAQDLNSVSLTGRLTKDPELRHTQGGTAVCSIRLAYTTRRKNSSGEWEDKSNFVDVVVWGGQGDRCAQWLSKGRRIGVQGRLEWREWEANDGSKRQQYEIVADAVVFLDKANDGQRGSDYTAPFAGAEPEQQQDEAALGVPVGTVLPDTEDGIPF